MPILCCTCVYGDETFHRALSVNIQVINRCRIGGSQDASSSICPKVLTSSTISIYSCSLMSLIESATPIIISLILLKTWLYPSRSSLASVTIVSMVVFIVSKALVIAPSLDSRSLWLSSRALRRILFRIVVSLTMLKRYCKRSQEALSILLEPSPDVLEGSRSSISRAARSIYGVTSSAAALDAIGVDARCLVAFSRRIESFFPEFFAARLTGIAIKCLLNSTRCIWNLMLRI